MIEFAFNSTLKIKRFIKNNYDGSRQYTNETTLPCYKEEKTTKVLSSTGEEVLSKTNYWTTAKITTDDIIDDNQILNVEHFSMLGISYYRSYI